MTPDKVLEATVERRGVVVTLLELVRANNLRNVFGEVLYIYA